MKDNDTLMKENQYLKYLVGFKEVGLQKRDLMLSKYIEQLTLLNGELKNY